MQLPHTLRMLAASLLLLMAPAAFAQSSLLDSLPPDTQQAIGRVCLPVQYREGAAAYRNCVQAELELVRNGSATELGKLSFDDKYAVQQACAKAGSQSSGDYQGCVSKEITALKQIPEPDLEQLSEDEVYVVQQSCFGAQSKEGAASYRTCLNAEIISLLSIPAADTSELGMLKKNALQLRCSSKTSNAVQYRQCVAAEYQSIAGTAPSFLPVSTATRIARQNVDTSNTNEAAVIDSSTTSKPTMALPRNITPPSKTAVADVTPEKPAEIKVARLEPVKAEPNIVEPIEQPVQQLTNTPEPITKISEAAIEPEAVSQPSRNTLRDATSVTLAQADTTEPVINTGEARVISRPDLVETLELQERAKAQGIELEAAEPTTEPGESQILPKLTALWQSTLDKIKSLDQTGWMVVAAVVAFPVLLLGLFSASRRRNRADIVANTTPLTERIEPGMQTRRIRQEREAAELFGDEPADRLAEQISTDSASFDADRPNDLKNDLPEDPFEDLPAHDAATRLAAKPKQPLAAGSSATVQLTNEPTAAAWQSALGPWISQLPAELRLESCIEFMIYWMAYGDERYPPDLRKRLFTATDLSARDQLKRWALKQDVFAFADVISWLRQNASQKQLEQSVALLMALLVTENNVTPAQNTLLRFLSDAFNVGKERFEQRFENAFGHPLPPVPRPDNLTWWAKQDDEIVALWDARATAGKPEDEQMLARLGLNSNFDETQVISAFRRAARRCHPDRFTALGERERALAEQQFIKFEQARDKLLGVSV